MKPHHSTLPFLVALTGGIASGKSTAAVYFQQLGVTIIDADTISHQLIQPGMQAYQAILKHFGQEICNSSGEIDRSNLKKIIFSHPHERIWLEQLLHPLILQEMFVQAYHAPKPYSILVIPLLTEIALPTAQRGINRVCVVDCDEHIQLQRLLNRVDHNLKLAKQILAAQSKREARLRIADDVIHNDGTLEALQAQVQTVHRHYLELAK